MNVTIKISLIFTLLVFKSCGTVVGDAAVDLVALNNVCVVDYVPTLHINANPALSTVDFQAVLSNPGGTAAHGSLRMTMRVEGTNVGNAGNPQTVAKSNVGAGNPYFEIPPATVYPANTAAAYTSPVIIKDMLYDPRAKYTVTTSIWIVGTDGADGTPCHNSIKAYPRK